MWRDATEREFAVFNGLDEQLISGLAIGATRCIGTYAVMPELSPRFSNAITLGAWISHAKFPNECCRIIYKMCSCHGSFYAVMKEILRREVWTSVPCTRRCRILSHPDMDIVSCAHR